MMDEATWRRVDDYIAERLLPDDSTLTAALAANLAAGLPAIDVSPPQGALLTLLVRMTGSRRVLEVGTLGGYSAICMARALPPGGKVVSLELSPKHAEVARTNIARAGLSDRVDIRTGRALDVLPQIEAEAGGPFDFVFIDADKPSNPDYVRWAVRLGRPGTVIVVDNVIRHGRVIDTSGGDANVAGARAAFDLIGSHPRLSGTAIQTVGAKGYDGFAIAIVGE